MKSAFIGVVQNLVKVTEAGMLCPWWQSLPIGHTPVGELTPAVTLE